MGTMSCSTLKELIDTTTGTLHVTRESFAQDILNISRDTIRNWERNENVTRSPRARYNFNMFRAFMEHPYDRLGELHGTSGISRESCDLITSHYNDWLKHYNQSAPYQNDNGEKSRLPHLKSSNMFAKLLRWKDGSKSSVPFETKKVGMGDYEEDLDIFDEAILYRHDVLDGPSNLSLRIELISSGLIEMITVGRVQHGLNVETYRNSRGRVAPLNFKVNPSWSEIIYSLRIFNGFQRGFENIAIKQFNDSTVDRMGITMDFRSVFVCTQFDQRPVAHHILFDGHSNEIPAHRSEDSTLWHTEYTTPAPNSRIRLSWLLK